MASDESSYITVRIIEWLRLWEIDTTFLQGNDFKVDGGLSSAYVTPIGDAALPPPQSLI